MKLLTAFILITGFLSIAAGNLPIAIAMFALAFAIN